MSVLLYAIAEQGPRRIGGTGVGERPLREIAQDGLVAVVSDHERPPHTLAPAHVRAYESALERAMARGAMLPARFGSVLADDPAVNAMLADRRGELAARLEAVRGAVELSVRAFARAPAAGPHASGTEYIRARLEERRRAAAAARALRPLDALAREVCEHDAAGDSLVRRSYLVDAARIEGFAARVAQLGDELPELDLVCTGPWPPFSFAGAPRP